MLSELIPAEAVQEAWDPIVEAARSKVFSIPGSLKKAVPKLTKGDLAKIRVIVRGVLEDLESGGKPRIVRPSIS